MRTIRSILSEKFRLLESNRPLRIFYIVLFLIISGQVAFSAQIDFNRQVRPILADNCFECHGPDEESRRADLRLDVLDDALKSVIVPGKPEKSELIKRILSKEKFGVMPPRKSKRQLTSAQIEILRKWVAQGATYQKHWAFVPPKRKPIPKVSNPNWSRNAIDSLVLAYLDANSLSPQSDAKPRQFARRLSLVLTGLPILPSRSEQFAAEYDQYPEIAIATLVDELLASPAFGEHVAWTWMDAARYADTNGYQGDGYRIMWPWRDWLIRNLNANLSFDKMTEQMLAGDLLLSKEHRGWQSGDWLVDEKSSELLKATGFLRNHRYDTGSGTIPEESKFENAVDRMETVSTVWMGLTLKCARCHTHKYDPIENREYYELLSFFDNVPEVGSALRGASHPYIRTPTADQRAELCQLHTANKKAKQALASARQRLSKAQAIWESSLNVKKDEPLRVSHRLRHRYATTPIQFDGKNSIKKSNDPILMCAGNKRWTISFWFRPESKKKGAIFSSVEQPERYRPGIQADWIDGKIRVRHVCRWVNSYIEFKSKTRLAVGQWHHITFRCDGRMQGLAYSASLNGSDEAMACTHPVTNDSANKSGKAPLILGGSPLMPGFIGQLRDLRFYDRLLNDAEVSSLGDSRSTSDLARIPTTKRTSTESETLTLAFLESEELPFEFCLLKDNARQAQAKLDAAISALPTTMVMQEGRTDQTRIHLSGVFDSLGNKVEMNTPVFLPPLPEGKSNRLSLARWLTHPNHPLTARVAVNRIWQMLWGVGFVDSPENFGTQCPEPLHSDLLDWLATEYIRLGWNTKALIKLIVTSRTYRQSSNAPNAHWQRDPQNRQLGRGPRFRLPVHVLRDQALYLSGRLDQTMGGPPVILDEVRGKDAKPEKLPFEKADRRRTLYTFWKRNSPHPMLAVFDVADRNQCEVRAIRTNTPLQALVTLNEPGFVAAAESLSKQARKAGTTEEEQLRWLWQACTGLIPASNDIRLLKAKLHTYRRLTNGSEDQAWSTLCNVLLNLDTTMTLE